MNKAVKVDSSSIDSVIYEDGNLVVNFKTGSSYVYYEVPEELYEKLLKADSVGSFFSKKIRHSFDYFKHVPKSKEKK